VSGEKWTEKEKRGKDKDGIKVEDKEWIRAKMRL